MKKIIDITEVVESLETPEGTFEVCATADAGFDEADSKLVVTLDSFVRPVNLRAKEQHVTRDWLPRKETITESVALEEAIVLAKDIFHRWVKKVRQAVASLAGR